MNWEEYIPVALDAGKLSESMEQRGPTILDFAGMSQEQISVMAEPAILYCIRSNSVPDGEPRCFES